MRISYRPLWVMLAEREITKKQLRELSGISTATLQTRMFVEFGMFESGRDSFCGAILIERLPAGNEWS